MVAEFSKQHPSNVRETIEWLLRLGRPPLPECPIEAAKQGKEPKQPCYFDGRRVIPINWKQWQNQQPISEIFNAWFTNSKTGIGTLGGWNGKHWLGWVDFDQKDFASPLECDTRVAEWVEQYPIMGTAPMFRTPSGGYRFLVAFSREPENFKANSGFSLSPDGSHHVGELLSKNGGHTLLPPTVGVSGKAYRWERFCEYPQVVAQPEDVGLYPVQKRTESKVLAALHVKQGKPKDNTDTSLTDFLEREIYPRLDTDVAFCWSGHDFKVSGDKLRGNCPWHESQSGTAFYVDKKDGTYLWRCPACNLGGSVISYRHRLSGGNGEPRGKDFVEIVRGLADDVGVSMPVFEQRSSASKVVPHEAFNRSDGNGSPRRDSCITSQVLIQHSRLSATDVNAQEDLTRIDGSLLPPVSLENAPYAVVKELVSSGMTTAQLLGALIELSNSCGYPLKGLQDLAREIEAELCSQSAKSDDALETNKLLEYREQTLDLRRVFPAPLASYLLTKADSDRIDPVFIYQYLWSAIGLSLGANTGIQAKKGTSVENDWLEFPIFYNMVVAPPSSGKSQTMRSVLGPIKRKQSRERAEYKKAQKHLEKLKQEWANKSPEEKERLKDSEANPKVYEQQMPQRPLVQLIEAGSPEGAFKRMSELPPMSGCALAFDELIRILSLDQYKNQGGDSRQILMEAWAHPFSTEFVRTDDNNTPSLNKICINITGGIQPTKAKKLLSDPDDGDGLLSRFLIAQTKTPENFAVWSDTQVDIDQALCGLYEFLSGLHFDLRQRVYGDDYIQSIVDGEQVILKFDASAQKRWQRWWEHVRDQMQRVEHENPALYGYLGKILSQTLRIALGLHCIELMYEDKADPLTIGLPTLERAIYAAKFHIGQFRLLQANNDTNNLPAQLAKIYQYAQRKGQEISATQVQNTVFKRLERKPSLAQIRENFKQLAENALVKLVGAGKDLKILVQKLVGIPTNSESYSDCSKSPQSSFQQEGQSQSDKNSDNSDNFSARQIDSEATVSQLEIDESAGGVREEPRKSDLSNHEDCRNCRKSSVDLSLASRTEPDVEIEEVSEKLSESVGISDTSSDATGVLNSKLDGEAARPTIPSGTGFGSLASTKQKQSNENPMPGASQLTVGARVAHSDPYTVAYSYHGTVESVTGDEFVVRWIERQGRPNERETYKLSELRHLEKFND